MAKLTKEKFIEALNEMNLLEINELVEAMEEAYGVNPNAVTVAQPTVSAATEEQTKFDVVLKEVGANKIAVIKVVREATGLGLVEAKNLTEAGGAIKEGLSKEDAEQLKTQFEEAGATIELQ